MNKIIALWATPRSISTAFEVMMQEQGDFDTLHEPLAQSITIAKIVSVIAQKK